MTTQTSAAERLREWVNNQTLSLTKATRSTMIDMFDAALAEARRDEREKVVAEIRGHPSLFHCTEDFNAFEALAAALSADATGAEGGDES